MMSIVCGVFSAISQVAFQNIGREMHFSCCNGKS
jgi:hypothetical protein